MHNLTLLILCIALTATLAYAQYACPPLPDRPLATNVRDLHVKDIKVLMAMGDSITAAFAETGNFAEDRGISWSIGCGYNQSSITLPMFFNYFNNQSVQGCSIGQHFPEVHTEPHLYPEQDVLNGAQSGAIVQDLSSQIDYLVQRMGNMSTINVKNDWKHVTIWIGANNLCGVCHNNTENMPDTFATVLDQALFKLQQEVPRLFVSLIPTMNLSRLFDLNQQSDYCMLVHDFFGECGCAFRSDAAGRQMMDVAGQQYAQAMHQLSAKYNAMGLDDFAVVVQPMLEQTIIPDISFLSSLDCFHPSLHAHEILAIHLWNSLFLPQDLKPTHFISGLTPVCPTDESVLSVD